MSAPETNIEKQKKRHRVPLFGMMATLVWAGVLLVGLIVWIFLLGNEPDNGVAVDEEQSITE